MIVSPIEKESWRSPPEFGTTVRNRWEKSIDYHFHSAREVDSRYLSLFPESFHNYFVRYAQLSTVTIRSSQHFSFASLIAIDSIFRFSFHISSWLPFSPNLDLLLWKSLFAFRQFLWSDVMCLFHHETDCRLFPWWRFGRHISAARVGHPTSSSTFNSAVAVSCFLLSFLFLTYLS